MKVKTSEAEDQVLDYLVAKCEQGEFMDETWWADFSHESCYSTDWEEGGLIIEREWLDVTPWPNESDEDMRWQCKQHDSIDCVAFGPTPLVAAMRCYVASKLGNEVEVPDELA
jgi:hypothetical protein